MTPQKQIILADDPMLDTPTKKSFPSVVMSNGAVYIGEWCKHMREGKGY
jgi:hypothetical protein